MKGDQSPIWSILEVEKTAVIDKWLSFIQATMDGGEPENFPPGSIPSYRAYPLQLVVRADCNVFFPALVAAKLLEWKPLMNPAQQKVAAGIVKSLSATFPLYKSRRGRIHYNFWPTQPDKPFPNGRLLGRFKFFRLPDDIDDTALVYTALEAPRQKVEALREDIELHLDRHYAEYGKIYGTWLGDKMPFVADACAMSNLLNLFNRHQLPPTVYSSETRSFLEQIITKQTFVSQPYDVSPYYPDTAIITWHLAKWLTNDPEANQSTVSYFKDNLLELYGKERHAFRKLLFLSSLLRLGSEASNPVSFDEVRPYFATYPWFYGNMLSVMKSKFLRQAAQSTLFHIQHVCECWNYSLWTEYRLLINRQAARKDNGGQ